MTQTHEIKIGDKVIVEMPTREGRLVIHGHVTVIWEDAVPVHVTVTGTGTMMHAVSDDIEIEGEESEVTATVPASIVEIVEG